jgi:hypothetical protein
VAVLAAALVIATGLLLALPRRRTPVAVLLAALVVSGAVVVAGGWSLQRRYLEHRYVDTGLHIDGIHAYFRQVHDDPVAVFGTVEVYPMLGLDLSNDVSRAEVGGGRRGANPCRRWRAVRSGTYRYVVFTQFGVVSPFRPPQDWFAEPAATEVAREGDSVVYRLDGALRPEACSSP